ncbi:putative disease resistance protein [Abeliophyllum distichum]|uniref:Disease resistance protein n=1 Tax=Abeliophyllum distichum TaxID=126358 RepID=A0ABD1UJ77_9LAMI
MMSSAGKYYPLSYTNLSHHLKECSLYTAIFPEDFNIPVSKLVKLWIAEGFLNLVKSKSLEDIVYEYLLDLVDRSLILVGKQNSVGKIKICKIHDLIRDFCTREAKKEMFFHISDRSLHDIPRGTSLRRLSIQPHRASVFACDVQKLSSVISIFSFGRCFYDSVRHLNPRPLRVFVMEKNTFLWYST